MPKQHATMRRVYEAAIQQKIIKGTSPLTELSDALGIDAPQRVKNWDSRGASAEAMLLIQLKTGINATWIETGEGPQMVAGWPVGRKEHGSATSEADSPAENAVIQSLTVVREQLARAQGEASIHAGDALRLLALTPDSERAFSNAADALLMRDGVPVASVEVKETSAQPGPGTAAEMRMQAMRLAEAHPNVQARALLTDFLGKLDTLMREPAPPTSKRDQTRHPV